MTRHRKATKADKKSRKKHDRRAEVIHRSQSVVDPDGPNVAAGQHHTFPEPSRPADATPNRDVDRTALAVDDAEQLLRRPPKSRTTPSGPPLGDHVEATAD